MFSEGYYNDKHKRAVGRADINNLFPEHNSETVRNILMILGRIIECRIQE